MSDFRLVSVLGQPVLQVVLGPSISAGTNSVSQGTVVFSNSNGVTFGMDTNGVVTATVAGGGGGGGGSFSAGVSTIGNSAGNTGTVSNQLVLAGGNNITLSQSTGAGGATVTISGANTVAQTNQTLGGYASSQTYGQSSSTTLDARSLSIVGSGGVSVGFSGGSLLVSGQTTTPQTVQTQASGAIAGSGFSSTTTAGSVPTGLLNSLGLNLAIPAWITTYAAQTNQSVGVYASSQTYGQSSSSTVDARSISVVGSGGVSVGMSNGSVLISGQTTAAQTNQTLGLYGSSNTTGQSSSSTVDARSLSIVGAGAASVGVSNGSLIISAPNAAAGNVTFSAGANSAGLGSVVFSNSNGVSFGLAGSTITASAVGAGDGGNVLAAGTQTATSLGTVKFADSNGISFGMSNSSVVTASYTVPSTAGLISAINVSADTTSNNLSALTFANSNGLTFGLNASTITASYTVPTQSAQTVGVYGSSQTYGQSSSSTVDARSLSVVGSGGVSVGLSAGSLLISGQTTTPQTNQTIGLYASSQTTAQSSSSTIDARSLTVVGQGNISVGLSAGSLIISQTGGGGGVNTGTYYATGNTTQSSSGTIALSSQIVQGTGGISVGVSNGSIVVSGPALTSLSVTGALSASSNGSTISLGVGTVTVSATSNTTQGSSGTVNLNGLLFAGAGAASVGITNGSVVVSAPNAGAGNVTFSAGANSSGLASVIFSNSNGVSFGLGAGSIITASVNAGGGGGIGAGVSTMGNTAGTTGTVTTGNVIFVGTGPISLSQSSSGSNATISINAPATSSLVGVGGISISTNGSTISVSYTGGAGGGAAMSRFVNENAITTTGLAADRSSASIFPVVLLQSLDFSNVRCVISMSGQTTTNNSTNGAAISISGVLYSRNGSTLSSINSASNTYSGTWSSNATASLFGPRGLTMDLASSTRLAPGEYWWAVHVSSATTAANTSGTSNLTHAFTMGIGAPNLTQMLGADPWAAATAATRGASIGLGIFSTGATRDTIAISAIQQTGSRAQAGKLWLDMRNYSLW